MKPPVLSAVIILVLSALAAQASLRLEGRLAESGGGSFDLRIEVVEKSTGREVSTLQTLLIPQVRVEGGRFAIALTTDLAPYDLSSLSFEVTARPTDSHKPFRPVADARVTGSLP